MSKTPPFEIQVHDLMHRPGNMREATIDVVLTEPMGEGAMAVPVNSTVEIDVRLESVHEGILATGEVHATAEGECSRCLEPLKTAVEVDFQELFAYSGTGEDDFTVQNELIELEPIIRDAVVLDLPFQPVCSQDCLGLCAECGIRLVENPNHVHELQVDSRWTELMKLKEE